MGSLFNSAARILNANCRLLAGETVTYRRGVDAVAGLVAVLAKTRNDELANLEPANITALEQDWIIAANDLAIAGQFILPQPRDFIDWTDARGINRTFRVVPRVGDRCYRFSDQTRQLLRIYTIEVIASNE